MANKARGEIDIDLGGEKGVICAEMQRLATLSHALDSKSLQDIYTRLSGAEPFAMFAVLDHMLIEGDRDKLRDALATPERLVELSAFVLASLQALVKTGEAAGK